MKNSTNRETLDRLERKELLDAWMKRPAPPAVPEGSAVRSIREDRDQTALHETYSTQNG